MFCDTINLMMIANIVFQGALSWVLANLSLLIFASVLFFLVGLFIFRLFKKQETYWLPKKWAWILIVVLTIFKILTAIKYSVLQYFAWKKDPGIGSYLLPPHQSWNYFAGYVYLHFFYATLLTIVSMAIFYFALKVISKHRAEIFEEGEIELGTLCALISGWPGFVIFAPLSFLILIAFSLVRKLFKNKQFTTITIPMLISVTVVFLFWPQIIEFLKLTSLIMPT